MIDLYLMNQHYQVETFNRTSFISFLVDPTRPKKYLETVVRVDRNSNLTISESKNKII
jgi:hypothetical protein